MFAWQLVFVLANEIHSVMQATPTRDHEQKLALTSWSNQVANVQVCSLLISVLFSQLSSADEPHCMSEDGRSLVAYHAFSIEQHMQQTQQQYYQQQQIDARVKGALGEVNADMIAGTTSLNTAREHLVRCTIFFPTAKQRRVIGRPRCVSKQREPR